MKRLRWIGLGLIALLALGSFSISLPRTFELVDERGVPHTTAYVAYLYEGHLLNPVHPVTYRDKPLALARGDEMGRVAIPMAFHAHLPFPVATHPSFRMELAYVPNAHNALGQIHDGAPARPGVFEMTSSRRAIVYDVSGDPELWQGSLMNLASLISRLGYRRESERPLRDADPASAALALVLIDHFRQEYDAILIRYRGVRRPTPTLRTDPWTTEDDKRRWKESVDASFAREPNWDQFLARMFNDELKAMGELERELRR